MSPTGIDLPESRSLHRLAAAGVALSMAASVGLAGLAHATHQSGTLSQSNSSLTWSNALITGANVNEGTCQEDVSCETFVLTLAPGNYTGRRITVGITWINPGDDWDLYVHEGAANGPIITQSAGGAPQTGERGSIPIDPPIVGTAKTYYVHVVTFAVAVPGYSGDAALVPEGADRHPTYLAGNLRFSENVALKAPVAVSDGEPSARVDVRGTCYVGAIRGVPAGVDLWRFDLNPSSPTFDPGMQSPLYLGQPDAFLPQDPNDPTAGGADGGGDIDISVSFPVHPDSSPVVTITSLALANISSAYSFDRGENFTLSPATAIAPADDRQWNESTGPDRVYLLYRAPIPATGLFVQRSDDHGRTYPVSGVVSPSGSSPGYIDVDHTSGPFAGRVYAAHSSSNALIVGHSADFGMTWRNNTVDNTTSHGTLFDVVKVGSDGTVYGLWSDQSNIWLAHSIDGGVTWSKKVRVNDNTVYRTNLFPWLEAGGAGRVAIVWYGTPTNANEDGSDWVVLFAQSLDATATNPTFRQQVISDHLIHGSNISIGGLTGAANRNLIDYFQVALDPQGAAVVAFTDDHNDFTGHTYVTRQLDGTSLYAEANGNGMVNPTTPPPLPIQDPGLPEVSDFVHDATAGLLQPIPEDNPFDVLWIDYSCHSEGGVPMLQATMKLSSLAAIPAGVWWRMNVTANAPGTSTGRPGLSDRGDQFYMRAATDDDNLQTFTWGTAVRASTGAVTYTERGTADFGVFDQANSTITVRVALSRLNAFANPDIGAGSLLAGLRGQTLEPGTAGSRDPLRDHTRGGATFTFQPCHLVDVPQSEARAARTDFVGKAHPNPARRSSSIQLEVARPGFVDLAVFDVRGSRVRTLHAGTLAPGRYTRTWDGRTDRFSDAPAGMYFFVLNSSDGVKSRRVALTR